MLQISLRRGGRGALSWLASTECLTASSTFDLNAQGDEQATLYNRQHAFQLPLDRSYSSLQPTTSSLLPPLSPPASLTAWHHRHFSSSTPNSGPSLPSKDQETTTPLSQPSASSLLGRLPASWQPYLQLSRMEKPIGTWLLAWPCFWSIALAAPPGALPDLKLLALFGTGAVLLRGAGCTINDLWDRDLDRQVERTRTRPLASGAVSPLQAVGWLGAQLAVGLGVLLQLNTYSQVLGASSLGLVVAYPLMKRVTGWPQAFLGLTFNWGALLGWAAARGACDWSVVLPLYAGGVAWTLVYDTIYAHQDKADDVVAGIKSTALTFGDRNRAYLASFTAVNVGCMAAVGAAAGCVAPFYFGLAAAGAHLGWQVASVDFDDAEDCANKFKSNSWYGALLFAGIVADRALAVGSVA